MGYKIFGQKEVLEDPLLTKKYSRAKKAWIIAGIISISSLIVSVSVSTYAVLRNKNISVPPIISSSTETTIPTEVPPYFINRDKWKAEPPRSSNIPKLDLPIKRIIIGHTRGEVCTNQNDCISTVRSIQTQDTSLDDIPYNFLIGGDGNIYEGRGFYYQGQHTQNLDATEYNSIGICIAFIGNYESTAPSSTLIDLLKNFIRYYVEKEEITEDHIIVLQDDLKYFEKKANSLNEVIKTFENFYPLYKIYRREEWGAQRRIGSSTSFSRTMDWVLIGHTTTPLCTSLTDCRNRVRSLQIDAFGRNPSLNDIFFNMIFGGDGLVFEGRGWDYTGAHAVGFNDKTIGVGVIGNFESVPPNQGIVNAMLKVFDDAMALGKLTEDFKIFGRSDFQGPGPGTAFMNIIKGWCRYGNRTTPCGITDTTTTSVLTTQSIPTTSTIMRTTVPYPEIPAYLSIRSEWGAEPPKSSNIPMLQLPIRRIIIGHTGGAFCTNQIDCISTVRSIQTQDTSLDDIPYNFLIGGDGKIYEGRGFNYEGQHTQNVDATEYNSIGICIAFIGNYDEESPSSIQIDLLKDFIKRYVENYLISQDYIIVSQDDLKYFEVKANALNEVVKTLDNFYPLYKIHRREEWKAERRRETPRIFDRTMNLVLIGHTVTPLCTNTTACIERARSLQQHSFTQEYGDILYNIFFGGDGLVFEGRGWDYIGAHARGFNDKTIGVGVIGDFTDNPPNDKILYAMLKVFDDAMALGKLTEDYEIFGRSDFGGPGPGAAFMNIIKEWCRYGNRTNNCPSSTTTPSGETTTYSFSEDTTTNLVINSSPVSRNEWGAEPPRSSNIPKLDLPIKRIIIGHTGGASCTNQNDCISTVRSIQTQDTSLDDIPYNFLIGGDGNIYEGRGFYYQGQHTQNVDATEYNSIGICIAFIGNYQSTAPNSALIDLLKDFLSDFMQHQIIAEDYIIVSQDDLKYFEVKANALNEVVKTLDNFYPLHKIHRREEWKAERRREVSGNFERTMDWVLIGHTVTPLCIDTTTCSARVRSLQAYAFSQNYGDIAYNIIFGGEGLVFEGRGWDYIGAHARGFNDKTIGVGAIGDFESVPPNQGIVNAMLKVFDDARVLGKLTEDYKIFGRSDFQGPGPGTAFMNIIREWCRYGNRTTVC